MQITLATVDCLRGWGAKSSIGWRVLSARRKSSSILCILMSKQCSGNREQISHKLIEKKNRNLTKTLLGQQEDPLLVGSMLLPSSVENFSNQTVPRILLHIHVCASLFYPQIKILLHTFALYVWATYHSSVLLTFDYNSVAC